MLDIAEIVEWLAIPADSTVVEIGCGYGTFTVPVAMKSGSRLQAFDIEPAMIGTARENIRQAGVTNVEFQLRDVVEQGTGLEAESVDRVLLFNVLHFSEKSMLFSETARIIKEGGIVAIIHWRKDIPTPRGPAIDLRPDMNQIRTA